LQFVWLQFHIPLLLPILDVVVHFLAIKVDFVVLWRHKYNVIRTVALLIVIVLYLQPLELPALKPIFPAFREFDALSWRWSDREWRRVVYEDHVLLGQSLANIFDSHGSRRTDIYFKIVMIIYDRSTPTLHTFYSEIIRTGLKKSHHSKSPVVLVA
jgi:hypothetical protein